jgi:hypothetical protein
MMGMAVSFGIITGGIQILFYVLGILCFIKYLRDK